MKGFLGTSAPLLADLVLVVTLALGIVAIVGAVFARRRRFVPHCRLLAAAALLNWLPLLVGMIPQWARLIGSSTSSPYTVGPMVHGVAGLVVQAVMTYTVVRMNWLKRLPPRRPRWLMRVTMALWMLSLLSGIGVYARLYTAWLE